MIFFEPDVSFQLLIYSDGGFKKEKSICIEYDRWYLPFINVEKFFVLEPFSLIKEPLYWFLMLCSSWPMLMQADSPTNEPEFRLCEAEG